MSLNTVATLVSMATGLVSMKVVAALLGPTGVALIGQLGNFSSITQITAGGGIGNGVVRYAAEHKDNKTILSDYLSCGIRIVSVMTLFAILTLVLLAPEWSRWVMKGSDYSYLFYIFGCTIAFYSCNEFLCTILNGFQDYRTYIFVKIWNSVVGLVFTVAMVWFWGLKGGLIAAITFQSVVLGVTLWLVRKKWWFNRRLFSSPWKKNIGVDFAQYSVMTLVATACVPVVQLFLRGYVMTSISVDDAGIWQGMNKLSSVYTGVFSGGISLYFLPRFAELKEANALRKELNGTLRVLIPIMVACFTLIYLFRYPIIKIVFSEEFYPMANLFIWQLCADFLTMICIVLGLIMMAKAMTKGYLLLEILSAIIYLSAGYFLVHITGIAGLCQARIVEQTLYLIFILIYLRKSLFSA